MEKVTITYMNSTKNNEFYSPSKLKAVAQNMLDLSFKANIQEAEISVAAGDGLEISVRDTVCESIENQQKQSLAITVYENGRKGSATTSDFSISALKTSIDAAKTIASNGEPDEYAKLVDKSYLCTDFKELELDHPWDAQVYELIELGKQVESAALLKATVKQKSDGVTIHKSRGSRAYVTTTGFNQAYCTTRHSITSVMIAHDPSGKMQKGYYFSSSRDSKLLENAAYIGQMAAARTEKKLGARKIATECLPVVFDPRVAPGLIGHLLSALSGKLQYEKASFLYDCLGKKVLPNFITVSERPHIIGGLSSATFDSEGVPTSDKNIILNGEIIHYILDGYSARKLNMRPTGNSGGITNIEISNSGRKLAEIISPIKKGLLVTELMGFGVNNLTGDYSRGATGFLIENGQLGHAVEEVTIAGNLLDMLADIVEVGNDAEINNSIQVGTVFIKKMTVAGN